MKERLITAAAVVSLLGAGFLLGSFWLEWRDVPLGESGDSLRTTVGNVPAGWEDRVRVEVLNGYGEPGAASAAAGRLRDMGFDVVYFGNAASFEHDSTVVLLRSDDRSGVLRVADSLGVGGIDARPEPGLRLDGTVLLGPDWERRIRERRERARKAAPADTSLLETLRRRVGL